ncbi:MAG: exosortase C-terminal domain/associated protein EpsI [Candidatus Eisenbacteria bacterium]
MVGKKNGSIVMALLAATLVYAGLISHVGGRSVPIEKPPGFGAPEGWRVEDARLREFEEQMLSPDWYVYSRYHRPGCAAPVYVFVGYFGEQRIERQIHSPLNCLPGSGWNLVEVEEMGREAGRPAVRRVRAEKSGEYRELCYWFVTPAGTTSSEYALKLALLKSGLLLRRRDAVFVRVSSEGARADSTCEVSTFVPEFEVMLNEFLAENGWPASGLLGK